MTPKNEKVKWVIFCIEYLKKKVKWSHISFSLLAFVLSLTSSSGSQSAFVIGCQEI
jgi:hypothetical protein